MFKYGDKCGKCNQTIRPNKHKGIITNERLVAFKDGWTIEVMVCTNAWNTITLCPCCVIKIITKGHPDSGVMKLKNDKIVRLNSKGFELKERDFEV